MQECIKKYRGRKPERTRGKRKGMYKIQGATVLVPRRSPYVWAGAATLCFLGSFYLTGQVRGISFLVAFRAVVQATAAIALVRAYRTVGGMEWLLWLAPVAIELAFWPKVLLDIAFHYTLWYPYWNGRALVYPAAFIAGFLLSRRRYLTYIRSSLAW